MQRGSAADVSTARANSGMPARSVDLPDLMEKVGAGWYQALILPSLLGVTVVECGQVMMVSSITLGLQLEWGLTEGQKALLPSLAFAGLGLGTIMSGFLSDAIGRRRTMLVGYMGATISSISLALSTGLRQMAFFTFINGIVCGIPVTAAMVLITELCPSSLRAAAFILPLIAQAMGEIYAATVIDVFMPDLTHGSWRNVIIFNAFPAYAFLFVSWFLLPESPFWLVIKGKFGKARENIAEIARMNGTLHEVEDLIRDLRPDMLAEAATNGKEKGKAQEGALAIVQKAMQSSSFFITAIGMAFLCFLGQLLTFGMNYFWPALLGNTVLEGISLNPAAELGVIRSFGVPSALLMIPIMRSDVGHRWIIAFSAVVEALTLQACIITISRQDGVALIPLAGLSLACANLFYAASLLFMTESFPTTVRATMSAASVFVGRIGALLGPALIDTMGYQGFLALVLGLSCAAVPVLMLLAETKGKMLSDYLGEVPSGAAASAEAGGLPTHEAKPGKAMRA